MLKKAKSIPEIFEEVKNYDLVITSDAPLATALNKLVESPRLGYLALTPKQIASKYAQLHFGKIYEKYEVVLKVSRLSKKPVNLVHQIIKKIYEVWMYNAKIEFAGEFLNEEEKQLLKYVKETDTIETAMENFNEEFYGDKNIAVVGEELFNLIDLEVLPRRGTPAVKIDLFKDEITGIDKTYIFPSTDQLSENILSLINKDNASQCAIVLNTESEYLEIIKSRLYEAGISIEIKNYLSNELSVRNFIAYTELSLRIHELTVKEYSPVAAEFGINIKSFYNQYDLNRYIENINKDEETDFLYTLSKNIGGMKFKELLEALKTKFDFDVRNEFKELLELLELNEKFITSDNILELKYFIKEFDTELESEKSGLLFVNALNSAYIDRQLIIYCGMDNSWMRLFPDKDYLNKEEEEAKNLERFQILIQQGKYRYYFVRDVVDYKQVIPCYYFQILAGVNIESFTDKIFNPVYINKKKIKAEFEKRIKKLTDEKLKVENSISPTDFNIYFSCPKKYAFDKLMPNEDQMHFRKGRLLHCFAEFYFNHPEFVLENYESILDYMTDILAMFLKNTGIESVRTDFRIGMDTIIKFIDESDFKKMKMNSPAKSSGNELMQFYKKDKKYFNTENWLTEVESTMIKGKVDLQSENVIVDYKSTKNRKTETKVSMQSNLIYIKLNEEENFDFQAIAYITALRGKYKEIEFIYNFILADYKNQISPDMKNEKYLTRTRYIHITFMEYLYTREVFDLIIAKLKNPELMQKLGFENYKYILDNLNLSNEDFFDKDILTNKVCGVILNVAEEKKYKYSDFRSRKQETFIEKFIEPVSAIFYKIRTGNLDTGMLFKDDADSFSELIKEKIAEINKYRNSEFPFEPVFDSLEVCKNCEYLNLCTGNKLWH